MLFQKKKITADPTLAEILKQQRTSRGVSLSQAAQDTEIAEKYLLALENNDYDKLPGELYNRTFLKKYAHYLGLGAEAVLEHYQREKKIWGKIKILPPQTIKGNIGPKRKKLWLALVHPQQIKLFIIIFLVAGFLTYLSWEAYQLLRPPRLIISWPPEQFQTAESAVTISGQTEEEIKLTINGQEVLLKSAGSFSEKISLLTGLNQVIVIAQKKIGKQTVKNLYILVSPPDQATKN